MDRQGLITCILKAALPKGASFEIASGSASNPEKCPAESNPAICGLFDSVLSLPGFYSLLLLKGRLLIDDYGIKSHKIVNVGSKFPYPVYKISGFIFIVSVADFFQYYGRVAAAVACLKIT